MDIPPYLVSSSVVGIVAQRLVRKIDKDCDMEINDTGIRAIIDNTFKDLDDEYKINLPLSKNPHNAIPSSTNPSGLKGRMPVFEILEVDHDIEKLILERKSEGDIWKEARKKGMINMREDAMIKSLNGIIPFTEVDSL